MLSKYFNVPFNALSLPTATDNNKWVCWQQHLALYVCPGHIGWMSWQHRHVHFLGFLLLCCRWQVIQDDITLVKDTLFGKYIILFIWRVLNSAYPWDSDINRKMPSLDLKSQKQSNGCWSLSLVRKETSSQHVALSQSTIFIIINRDAFQHGANHWLHP